MGRTPDACAGCLGSVVTGADALIQCTAQEDCQVHQRQASASTVVRSAGSSGPPAAGSRLRYSAESRGRCCHRSGKQQCFRRLQSLSVTGVLLNFLNVVGGSLRRTVSEQLCVLRGRSLSVHGNQCSISPAVAVRLNESDRWSGTIQGLFCLIFCATASEETIAA